MSGFFHGVTVTNVDTGTRTISLPSSSIIGLVDTFTEGPDFSAKANELAADHQRARSHRGLGPRCGHHPVSYTHLTLPTKA